MTILYGVPEGLMVTKLLLEGNILILMGTPLSNTRDCRDKSILRGPVICTSAPVAKSAALAINPLLFPSSVFKIHFRLQFTLFDTHSEKQNNIHNGFVRIINSNFRKIIFSTHQNIDLTKQRLQG